MMLLILLQVLADCYLSGMLAVIVITEDGCLVPACRNHCRRGVNTDDIEQILTLTVREAHMAGLFETVPDAVPHKLRPSGWKKRLAADCYQLLKGKIVTKSGVLKLNTRNIILKKHGSS